MILSPPYGISFTPTPPPFDPYEFLSPSPHPHLTLMISFTRPAPPFDPYDFFHSPPHHTCLPPPPNIAFYKQTQFITDLHHNDQITDFNNIDIWIDELLPRTTIDIFITYMTKKYT